MEELNGSGGYDEEILELSPLDYLVSVMHDPDAAPRERIKAARAAAPYLHAHPEMADMPIVIEDPFGFPVDPVVAKEIREDQERAVALRSRRMLTLEEAIDAFKTGRSPPDIESPEYRELTANISKRLKMDCPASYGAKEEREDQARLAELSPKSNGHASKRPLAAEEVAERDHLQFRLWLYQVSPARKTHIRMGRLLYLKDHSVTMTPAEASELDDLLSRNPEHHAQQFTPTLSEAMEICDRKRENQTTGWSG